MGGRWVKTGDFASETAWRAHTLPSWRGNASGVLFAVGYLNLSPADAESAAALLDRLRDR